MRPEGNDGLPLRVTVSGGIGSGKTTVLTLLERLGFFVVEADRIGHAVLEPDGAAAADVGATWPAVVVDGRIDRGKLAAIVFADEEQLRLLESLTHPHIAAEVKRLVEAHRDRDVAVELPLTVDLLGEGWTHLVVSAPDEIRRRRAIERGLDELDVSRRMASQPESAAWIAGADVVIDNAEDISDLESRVASVVRRLRTGVADPAR